MCVNDMRLWVKPWLRAAKKMARAGVPVLVPPPAGLPRGVQLVVVVVVSVGFALGTTSSLAPTLPISVGV